MKNILAISIIITLFASILLASGCVEQDVTCNKPYILVGKDCCLDANDNSICDTDETVKQEEPKAPEVADTPIEPERVEEPVITGEAVNVPEEEPEEQERVNVICGDDDCDDSEIGRCFPDCPANIYGGDDPYADYEAPSCGDGECSGFEATTQTCPEDCDSTPDVEEGCHIAHSSSSQPDFEVWFEEDGARVTSYTDKIAGVDYTNFDLMVETLTASSLICDVTEYYNDEINEEFELQTFVDTSLGINPMNIIIEPKATEGTLQVKYRLTCYNFVEYSYKDTCDTIESRTKTATIPLYFIES